MRRWISEPKEIQVLHVIKNIVVEDDVIVVLLDRSDASVTEKDSIVGVNTDRSIKLTIEKAPVNDRYDWFAGISDQNGEL